MTKVIALGRLIPVSCRGDFRSRRYFINVQLQRIGTGFRDLLRVANPTPKCGAVQAPDNWNFNAAFGRRDMLQVSVRCDPKFRLGCGRISFCLLLEKRMEDDGGRTGFFHPFDLVDLLGERGSRRHERRAQLHSEVSGKIHGVIDCQLPHSANLAAHHFGEFARWIRTKIDCVNNRGQLRSSAVSFVSTLLHVEVCQG